MTVMDWQRRFRAGVEVWVVTDCEGHMIDLHESEESALVQVDWQRRHGKGLGYRTYKTNIHTLGLSRERWGT